MWKDVSSHGSVLGHALNRMKAREHDGKRPRDGVAVVSESSHAVMRSCDETNSSKAVATAEEAVSSTIRLPSAQRRRNVRLSVAS